MTWRSVAPTLGHLLSENTSAGFVMQWGKFGYYCRPRRRLGVADRDTSSGEIEVSRETGDLYPDDQNNAHTASKRERSIVLRVPTVS